jgi:hypothetical protein
MYCLCVNVYCHRVTTQLQLINISISTCLIYTAEKAEIAKNSRMKLHYLYIMNLCNGTACLLSKLKPPSVDVIQKLRAQKLSTLATG